MKKTGIFAPKTQFFPFKTQCTAGLRPELSCRKVYKKKPDLRSPDYKVLVFWVNKVITVTCVVSKQKATS